MQARGQARLIEAMIALGILVMLVALLPLMSRFPETPSTIPQSGASQLYVTQVVNGLAVNPSFLNAVQDGNWSRIYELINKIVPPQYNWRLIVEPLSTSVGASNGMIPITVYLPSTPPVPYVTIPIDLNVKFINSALAGANRVNLTLPLSNVGFYVKGQSGWVPITWWLEYLDNESGNARIWMSIPANKEQVIYMTIGPGGKPINPNGASCEVPYNYNDTCAGYSVGGISAFYGAALGLPYGKYDMDPPKIFPFYTNFTKNSNTVSITSNGANYVTGTGLQISIPGSTGGGVKLLFTAKPQSATGFATYYMQSTYSVAIDYSSTIEYTINNNNGYTDTLYVYSGGQNALSGTLQETGTSGLRVYPPLLSYKMAYKALLNCTTKNNTKYLTVSNYAYVLNYYIGQLQSTGWAATKEGQVSLCPSSIPVSIDIEGINPENSILYNDTFTIYDLWWVPLYFNSSATIAIPYSVNYGYGSVVPIRYQYRYPVSFMVPTASDYALMELSNGSIYILGLSMGSIG